MKKIMLVLIAVIGTAWSVNAQYSQCKIAGTDNSTATVSVLEDDADYITVEFNNDSEKTVTICFTSISGNGDNSQGCCTVQPNSSNTQKFRKTKQGSTTSIKVSSAKCI